MRGGVDRQARLFARELNRAGRRVNVRRRGGLVGSDLFVVAQRAGLAPHELIAATERQAKIAYQKWWRSTRRRARQDPWTRVMREIAATVGVTDGDKLLLDDVPPVAEALGMSVPELLDLVDAQTAQRRRDARADAYGAPA